MKAALAWTVFWEVLAGATVAGAGLDWQEQGGYRSAALNPDASGRAGFTRLAPETTGVDFTNLLSEPAIAENQIRLSGSGVALGDVDGNGWTDLYFCRLEGPNALYLNQGGWRFEEKAAAWGCDLPGQYSTGALLADVEGDGDLDLLVNELSGGTRLLRNAGQTGFREDPGAGLRREYAAMSMAMADVEGDGDLDLYVANYRSQTVRSTGLQVLVVNGRRMLRPEDRDSMYITEQGLLRERGEPDFLYVNDGGGRFEAIDWTGGRFRDRRGRPLGEAPREWGYSVAFRDVNGDGAPDLYICNDFWSPDHFWINDGEGGFSPIDREALPCTSSFSMGVDFADLNADGFEEFFVLDMLSPDHPLRMRQSSVLGMEEWPLAYPEEPPQVERNTLYLNRGDGTYAEIAQFAGVHATDWSWCPIFMDVDLDGRPDLLVSNGYSYDTQDADAEARVAALGRFPGKKAGEKILHRPPLYTANSAWRNQGNLRFEPAGESWGFDRVGVSQGMAAADLDNDGDLDLAVNHLNEAAGLYRNDAGRARIAVRLRGGGKNTRAIGARVRLKNGPVALQTWRATAGGRYLSSEEPMAVFAAGEGSMTLEVEWPDGRETRIENPAANRIYEISADSARSAYEPKSSAGEPGKAEDPSPLFEEVERFPEYSHSEQPFDDFSRQPNLPYRISQLGPGAGWFDVDEDGWEDLLVGSGRGGRMAVFLNRKGQSFEIETGRPFHQPVTRDQTSVLGVRKREEIQALAGSSNYEDGLAYGSPVRAYDLRRSKVVNLLPGMEFSAGPLALADFDGDGDLDLFAGGLTEPGHYPRPADSQLWINRGGTLERDESNAEALRQLGLVKSALWTDLTGDYLPELVLTTEWGPLRIFANENGALRDATEELGLNDFSGLWNGAASGDFNNDGRMDLIAGNWGQNTKYEPYRKRPARVYFADWEGDSTTDIVEAHYEPSMGQWVPDLGLDALAEAIPSLKRHFESHQAYGLASIQKILSTSKNPPRMLEANWLESSVLLNRGSHFEVKELPLEAQLSPVFGVAVADFNGDGNQDAILTQNMVTVHSVVSPYVSGRGAILLGLGNGDFDALSARESGFSLYGSGRGSALGDFDRDGRMDAAAAQNNGPVKLFHNIGGRPGFRVILRGTEENPEAVGARLRKVDSEGAAFGPAWEVQSGAGHWSQNSRIHALPRSGRDTRLEIRWPGGETVRAAIPETSGELIVEKGAKEDRRP